jgi:hypothetical protein
MNNMTYFATGELYETAKQAYHRVSSQSENTPHNDALVAVLFSAATLESFMSQAVFVAETWSHLNPKIEVFAQFIGELEGRETGSSLKTKYYMAHWIICGTPFDRGRSPYQDFDLLVDLRNALIHLKPDKLGSEKTRKLLARLKSSNLIPDGLVPNYDPSIPEQRTVWVHYVSTATVAKWACNTAAAMIEGLWRNAPEEEIRQFFYMHANAAHYVPLEKT